MTKGTDDDRGDDRDPRQGDGGTGGGDRGGIAVDWIAVDAEIAGRSTADRLTIAAAVVTMGLATYDWLVLPAREPLLEIGGWGLVPPVAVDPDGVTWLFLLSILAVARFGAVPLHRNQRLTRHYWRRFRRNRAAVVASGYLLVVFLVGTLGPLVLDPPELELLAAYQPPVGTSVDAAVPIDCVGEVADGRCHGTWRHPLGTTGEGKDVLVAIVYGMTVSMQVGLIGTMIIVALATGVGTTAAYFGGWVDEILMRKVDLLITFPTFFLYLLLVYLFGGSLLLMILIFGLTGWGGVARIVRSEALQRREEAYVLAARNAGASGWWVIRRHLLPNVTNSVITAASLLIPLLILFEAALSFLELGDPTIPSWGQLIAAGRGDLSRAWWISTLPGVFLFLTVLGFNFVGDALRDAIDPRQER